MFSKTLKFGLMGLVLSCGGLVFAEENQNLPNDNYVYKGGRVMVWRNGRQVPMPADTTFADGSRLTRNGTWVSSDGTRRTLVQDQRLTNDGKLVNPEPAPTGR